MRITKKIKMFVIPMVLFPFFLAFLALCLVVNIYVQSAYGSALGSESIGQMGNPIDAMNSLVQTQMEILLTMYDNRELDEINSQDMDSINESLRENNAFLVIKKADKIIYQGVEHLDMGLKEQLPGAANHHGDIVSYITVPKSYMFRQIDFQFTDGDSGSVFLIAYLGDIVPKFKKVAFSLIMILVFVSVSVSILISAYMYHEFVRPIKSLKHGTTAIMEGDWDYNVKVDSDDELGELCQSFNNMRNELKHSMQQQVEAEEKNRELIANISHDLKTPVTSIKGYAEGLMDGVANSPEKVEKYIRIIYNKANEMDAMINELSLYTKLNSNAIPYNFQAISIDNYMQDCIDEISELGNVAASRGKSQMGGQSCEQLQVKYKNYCRKGTKVMADPEKIRRVVSNIITNSQKYCDKEQCEVDIRLKPVNDMVQFEFEDNGCGISEEDLPNIFNRTYRADEARRSMGGSGLGLAIAKKVVEEHGGAMWATSRLGVGTSIFFTLQSVEE